MTYYTPKRQPPNCDEMIKWLIEHNGYTVETTLPDLYNDRMLGHVSSVCNLSIDDVVEKVKQAIISHHNRKMGYNKGHEKGKL